MTRRALALATDLYELTMAAAYFDNRIQTRAIFELFVRRLPERRSYLISAGLEQAIDYLMRLRFSADEIASLREHPAFADVSPAFFDYLAEFRFNGDVWAMPEGTAAFSNEPLLRVAAPIIEAQIVDTLAAVERLARDYGPQIAAVRLDSGDLRELSVAVREILDRAGMQRTKIFASSDLNEYRIAELLAKGARIDSFGVGTELATSFDAPALSAVYKLVGLQEDGRVVGRIKLSKDKATYPGPKQVWRETDAGRYRRDLIAAADDAPPGPTWQPLLEAVMSGGRGTDERFPDCDVDDKMPMAERRATRKPRPAAAHAPAARQLRRLPHSLLPPDT